MAKYQMVRRLERILHLLKTYRYRTKKELMHRLAEDYEIDITARTLERDFKALETDFGIGIRYDRTRNGYALIEEDDEQMMNFLRFAGRIYIGDLLQESLQDYEGLKKSIKLEDYSDFKGIQLIQPLLVAIKRRCEIQFVHENYQKQTRKDYQITPLQLREYQGRWYVVGVPRGENHIKTFGLARIAEFETLGASSVSPDAFAGQLEKFDGIIGLNYDAAEQRERIELAVTRQQYKYLETLPLHRSQRFIAEMEDGRIKISLFLIPNYALKMQILKLGHQVEVLQPKDLRSALKSSLNNTLKHYLK